MNSAALRTKNTPTILPCFQGNRSTRESAQTSGLHGVQLWMPGEGDSAPSHTLTINGDLVSFKGMASAPSPEPVRTHIESSLKAAGVDRSIADLLASLLCESTFVEADRAAIQGVLAETFVLGAPKSRELDVVTSGPDVTVSQRSAWSSCQVGDIETGQHIARPDLLTVNSGVSFHAGQRASAGVQARPHSWVHATADSPEGARLNNALSADSTLWDCFVDALASGFKEHGVRFERAENLGQQQASNKTGIHTPFHILTIAQHIASFATPQTRNAMLQVSKVLRQGAEKATEHLTITGRCQLVALKARLNQSNHSLKRLDSLSLCGHFTDADLDGLPTTITKLDLRNCRGTTPAGLLRCLKVLASSLTGLDLSCQVPVLDSSFAEALAAVPFERLTVLHLAWNNIGDAGAQALADCMHHSKLTVLDVSGNSIGSTGVRALANSVHLSKLILLDVSRNQIGDPGALALANSKHLSQLNSLNVGFGAIGDAGARALANSKHLSNLTSLELRSNQIGEAGAQALADSKHLSQLRLLNVHDNGIGVAGVQAMANSEHLSQLKLLHVSRNQIGEAGAQALANSGHLANLTSLDLHGNQIGVAGAQALAQSKHLSQLNSLNVGENGIGSAGALALANSGNLANLKSLSLHGNQIGIAGAQALANSEHLSQLNSLNVSYNAIGDTGALELANSEYLTKLTLLDVVENQIGDTGAQALANNKHLFNLTSLNFGYNKIGDTGALALANSNHLSKLTVLDLYCNQIGDAGAQALANSTTMCSLTELNLWVNPFSRAGVLAAVAGAPPSFRTRLRV